MVRQLKGKIIWAAALAALLVTSGLRAEGNPFEGETVIQNGGGPADGSASDPIVQQSVGDVNSIQDNSALNDQRGRREKLEDDAIPKGQAGVGAAIAAGVSLTAAGTPMLASPIAAVRARGAALLAKAGLEFAQAAATAGVNQQNRKAADAVNKNSDGPTGSQLSGPSPEDVKKAAAEQVNSPELQKALGEAGINSDDFVNKLVNGEMATPDAVLAAAGSSTDGITPEMLAAGTVTSSDTNGREAPPRIGFDDSPGGKPAAPGAGGGNDRGLVAGQGGQKDGEGAAGASPLDLLSQAQSMASRAMELARQSGTDKILGLSESDLVGKYMAALMKQNGSKQAFAAADLRLMELGIKRLRPKQNIFHVARKSYRDYGRWRSRKNQRLAQIAPAAGPVVK
jgi:hypothetical protein